jgi:dihydroorotate dehydrogenase electron transfer subunit
MPMPSTIGQKGIFLTTVTRRRTPCREHFEVTLGIDHFPDAQPGQFLQVLCRPPESTNHNSPSRVATVASGDLANPFLRRPFSIAGMRRTASGCEIDLLGRVVGEGTAWLNRLAPGDIVDVLGPLGRPFSTPPAKHRAILVAGGIGLPPIRWLGETLRTSRIECTAFYGALTRDLLPITLTNEPMRDATPAMCVEDFARHGIPTAITTDDGTCGLAGRVTVALNRYLDGRPDRASSCLYACGPEPMLHVVADLAAKFQVGCELAMERVMGCGMGTCQSCVIPVRDSDHALGWRYALCCTEGPVFAADRIIWR